MPASFDGAIRVVQYRGENKDCLIPIPPFWAKYVWARNGRKKVVQVKIDMDEEGVLTIAPYATEIKKS